MKNAIENYDLVLVGTGFASSFFLVEYLKKFPTGKRVLVLERGKTETPEPATHSAATYEKMHSTFETVGDKRWIFTPEFGGGTNCWWACTPRFMPNDFKLKSVYGVGTDWPFDYETFEPYYTEAEQLMQVSGVANPPYPMSQPFPQPAHVPNAVDRIMMKAYPNTYFIQPTARARQPTKTRPSCCTTGICDACPINAKFMTYRDLSVYSHPSVELKLGAQAHKVGFSGNVANEVEYFTNGENQRVRAEIIALGANPFFNVNILQNSGDDHPELGYGVTEQTSFVVHANLDGVDNYDGSTSITGHCYEYYEGEHRRDYAACLIENNNVYQRNLRLEKGRYRQTAKFKMIIDDLPEKHNRITLSDTYAKPRVIFKGHSEYAMRGYEKMKGKVETFLSPLPVENYEIEPRNPTEAHILGGAPMGDDPTVNIVDRYQRHHRYQNLFVLGGSSFPTPGIVNPTLTISALSLWAARGGL